MRIELNRDVQVSGFEGLLSISRSGKQDHLVAVAMLAEENGDVITPDLICQKLLPGRSLMVGQKVIERCKELGILGDHGEITAEGRRAIQRQTVFIPERGRYAVYFTEDPLIKQSVIDVTAVQEPKLIDSFNEETNSKTGKKKPSELSALPPAFRSLEGKETMLLGNKKELVKFLVFEDKTTRLSNPTIRKVSATLTVGDDTSKFLRLTGDVSATVDPPHIDFLGIMKEILRGSKMKWGDPVEGRLCCSFGELTETECIKFMRDIELKSVPIKDLGEFNSVRISDVPIAPATKTDANKWAMSLLMNKINNYLSSDIFERYRSEVVSVFKKLDYRVELPSQRELAQIVKEFRGVDEFTPDPKYWFLQAPIDLSGTSVAHTDVERRSWY